VTALQTLAPEAITLRIATVRSQRVIVDADLAALYGVETKRFNEAVKRNLAKFPADFMFTLTAEEFAALRSQFATSNIRRGGRRSLPCLRYFMRLRYRLPSTCRTMASMSSGTCKNAAISSATAFGSRSTRW